MRGRMQPCPLQGALLRREPNHRSRECREGSREIYWNLPDSSRIVCPESNLICSAGDRQAAGLNEGARVMVSFQDENGSHGFDASGRAGQLRQRSVSRAMSIGSMIASSFLIAGIFTTGSFFMEDASASAAKAKGDLWKPASAVERPCVRTGWPHLPAECLQRGGIERPVRQIAITRTAGSTTFVSRAPAANSPSFSR